MKTLFAFLGSSICLLPSGFSQGALTPPGPPAPAMKTLAQIEPRTPISSLPFAITGPGSYYVTTNLTGPGGPAGITISADNVTLDLNGFELAGLVGGGNNGISISGTHTNLTIRNGALRDWDVFGISAGNVTGGHYERLKFSRAGSGGLNIGNDSLVLDCTVARSPTSFVVFAGIGTGTGCIIRNCVVTASAALGISAGGGSTINACTVEYPVGNGITAGSDSVITACAVNSGSAVGIAAAQNCSIRDCNASNNSTTGITAGNGSTIGNCTANNNGGAGIVAFDAATIQNCATRQNSNGGISAGNSSTVSDCTVVTNTNDGITTGNGAHISHCVVSGSRNGILTGDNCLIISCASSVNSSDGVFVGSGCTVKDCTVALNVASGIRAVSSSLIVGNIGTQNAVGLTNNANIYVTGSDNQIMENNLTSGGRGIKADAGYNLIVKNKATLNSLDFELNPNSVTGPISNSPTNAGPWANFSF